MMLIHTIHPALSSWGLAPIGALGSTEPLISPSETISRSAAYAHRLRGCLDDDNDGWRYGPISVCSPSFSSSHPRSSYPGSLSPREQHRPKERG
jgi:hypothetical protein